MNRTQYIRLLSVAGSFLVGIWLPFRLIGFAPSSELEILFDLIVAVVSLVNVHLYFLDSGADFRRDASWLNVGLLLDCACVLPVTLTALLYSDASLQWLLVSKLLMIRHVRHIRTFLDGFASLKPLVYRLVPLIFVVPLLVHLVACGWYALGSGTAALEADPVLMYVKAIYWAFTTLTTVGYGDITAKTIPQMLYSCCVQVAGVGVFGFILSNVAGLLARSDAAREHHMDSLDKIETYMKIHDTPVDLKAKIRTYYHYMWTTKKGYQDGTLLEGLPAKIQSELFLHINQPIISKVSFLRGADPELLAELMSELKPRICVPEERLFKIDEPGDALYLIQNGTVEIIGRDGSIIATLSEGAFFGEMALISDRPRGATAIATTFCDIYVLRREVFKKVMTAYPSFRDHLERVMQDRRAS